MYSWTQLITTLIYKTDDRSEQYSYRITLCDQMKLSLACTISEAPYLSRAIAHNARVGHVYIYIVKRCERFQCKFHIERVALSKDPMSLTMLLMYASIWLQDIPIYGGPFSCLLPFTVSTCIPRVKPYKLNPEFPTRPLRRSVLAASKVQTDPRHRDGSTLWSLLLYAPGDWRDLPFQWWLLSVAHLVGGSGGGGGGASGAVWWCLCWAANGLGSAGKPPRVGLLLLGWNRTRDLILGRQCTQH